MPDPIEPTIPADGGQGPVGGAVAPAPAQPPAPAPIEPQPAPTPAAPAPAPAQSADVTPGADQSGIINYAREKGLDLTSFADDESAMEALLDNYAQSSRLRQYAEMGAQVAPHYDQFNSWLSSQGGAQQTPGQPVQPGQPQQPAEPPLWDAPEYDPAWAGMVESDQQGNIIPKPGISPEIPAKMMRYANWMRSKETEFWRDPDKVLGPIIAKRAREEAEKLVKENLGSYQDQITWDEFAKSSTDWMVHRDENGQPVHDRVSGQPILTPDGQRWNSHYQRGVDLGIQGTRHLIEYANTMLTAERGAAPGQAGAPQQAGNRQQTSALSGIRGVGGVSTPSHAASTAGNGPQNTRIGLADRLRNDFDAAGVTDADVSMEIAE